MLVAAVLGGLLNSTAAFNSGTSYTITVGSGGSGGVNPALGLAELQSSIFGISATALGGGGGGAYKIWQASSVAVLAAAVVVDHHYYWRIVEHPVKECCGIIQVMELSF